MIRNKARAALGSAAALSAALVVGGATGAEAAASCNAADFTVNGVFDLQGYLACTAGQGGGLPATGNSTLQIAGIAVGLLAIGGGILATARKRPDEVA